MPSHACPIVDCDYSTGDVDPVVAAALLIVHNNTHVEAAAPPPHCQAEGTKIIKTFHLFGVV